MIRRVKRVRAGTRREAPHLASTETSTGRLVRARRLCLMDYRVAHGFVQVTTAVVGFFAALGLTTGLLMSQTPPSRTIVYTSQIGAPEGTVPRDFRPPPTALERRAALSDVGMTIGAAYSAATESVPPVPWGTYGLARVHITFDMIRWDDARMRYVADLDDDMVAILTLEPSLQRHIETILSRYPEPGEAAVAIDPSTGRVLAIVQDGEDDNVAENLTLRSFAWAASVFKVITAAAALDQGIATLDTEICYSGGSSGFGLADMDRDPPGDTCRTMVSAMAHSANLYFAKLADRRISPAMLQNYAESFGFNARVPFEMPVQRSVAALPEDRLELARAAAGFRHTTMSPLHGALMMAGIANDGVMMVPTLVASIENADGDVVYTHEPTEWRRMLRSSINARVADTMATTAISGTARRNFAERNGWPSSIRVWGKTGTLANRTLDGQDSNPHYLYTWFAGFAESGDRRVAVSGLAISSPTWHIRGSFIASELVLGALR